MNSNNEFVKPKGFSEEEKRLRRRMVDLGIRQQDVCRELGLQKPDVSHVISCTSRSPRYIAAVYEYLGLDMPVNQQVNKHDANKSA